MLSRTLKVLLVGGAVLFSADYAYYVPRYGGFAGYLTGSAFAGVESVGLDGKLGGVLSALSIYYGDTNGKYPETLDVLWKDKKYLPGPLGHADVYAEFPGKGIARAHWYRDTDKIKYFRSVQDADDAGGWGYVNDPSSPQYGTVFINCTHVNFRKGIPWNVLRLPPASAAATTPAPAAAAEAAARQGFRGYVRARGAKVVGAEIVFTSEDWTQTVRTKSDAWGRYQVDLPPGRYRVAATHPQYQPYSTGNGFFVVTPGVIGVGNILLVPTF